MAKKGFYITTPLYYLNGPPHLGHAYTTVIADVIARWHRLRGEKVFFLTGTDEHGDKILEAAQVMDKGARQLVDELSEVFRNAWDTLDISYDDFIRTTEARHKRTVKDFILAADKKGDVYKGNYSGFYCVGCESYKTESEMVNGECPDHKRMLERRMEESYFFRLSKYQKELLKFYRENPGFIYPAYRADEVKNRVKDGLKDLSISRENLRWGIEFPLDKSHTTYVWFDALTNYVSALGGRKSAKFKRFWPADVHLMGKEINWFHSVIWPAMLLSVGIRPPRRVVLHGWWLVDGQKMSKTLGNVIDPLQIVSKYSVDAFRYYLVRDAAFGEDGDFSEKKFVERINGELVADLGNLVYRALTLAEKYDGKVAGKPFEDLAPKIKSIERNMDDLKLNQAMDEIWQIVRDTNKYISRKEPWKMQGRELGDVIYNLMERIRIIAILIRPFMPGTSMRISMQLGLKPQGLKKARYGPFKARVKKGGYLFAKVETK